MTILRTPFGPAAARVAASALVLLLAACASDPSNVRLGESREQVLQQVGNPSAVYPMQGGQRLQYSRGPAGFQVNNIDIDSAGRVRSVRQELDEGLFDRTIRPGDWGVNDVLFTYGPPAERTRVASFDGTVWTWNYLQSNSRRFLNIYVDPSGRVDHFNVGDDLRDDRRRW